MIAHQARPIASVTIEPKGTRTAVPRDHLIKVTLTLNPIEPKFTDTQQVAAVARKGLEGFAPSTGPDRRRLTDVLHTSKGKTVVIGVEGSVLWPGRPDDQQVGGLRAALMAAGYNVNLRGVRECVHPECLADAQVEWNRPALVPASWYSNLICGRHDYRSCSKCNSIYLMTSTSAIGQAPSVSCEVCGGVMVGWGGSKIWHAELVTNGPEGTPPPS